MLNALRHCFSRILKYILSKIRFKKIRDNNKSSIHAYQDSFFGFLLTMHNNVNLYNVNFNSLSKEEKIKVLDEIGSNIGKYGLLEEFKEITEVKFP